MRSVPEKTLEHWASIYLASRFPNGAMWWPTSGEDVLVELPRLAASGPGKTLALELKTTEATGAGHVLWIDARQLDRYLNPPFGPPLPVYYVFPVPHWTGPLTSRSGTTPAAPAAMTAVPPEWWRRRVGWPWFGDWLYVMSAQSLSEALPPTWATLSKARARLFALSTSHTVGGMPNWTSLFARTPTATPMAWTSFWRAVTRCGPGATALGGPVLDQWTVASAVRPATAPHSRLAHGLDRVMRERPSPAAQFSAGLVAVVRAGTMCPG